MVQESVEKVRGKLNGIKTKIDRIPHWAIIVLLAALCFGTGYACGLRNADRTDVYNHGNGADTVTDQLDRAEDNQRSITDGLQRAADQSGRITGEIDESRGIVQDIAESADRAAGQIDQAGSLIDSSQRILERVRQRGKTDPAKD